MLCARGRTALCEVVGHAAEDLVGADAVPMFKRISPRGLLNLLRCDRQHPLKSNVNGLLTKHKARYQNEHLVYDGLA